VWDSDLKELGGESWLKMAVFGGNRRFLALFGDLIVCNSFVFGGCEIFQCRTLLFSTNLRRAVESEM
jgi:hypothetical protein